jgi:hypothetical protein
MSIAVQKKIIMSIAYDKKVYLLKQKKKKKKGYEKKRQTSS